MRVAGRPAGRRQQARFLVVGVYNTAFAYAVFAGAHLVAPRLHYLVDLVLSHVIGVLHAYVTHRWIVFRARGGFLVDLIKFWSVYLASLAVNAAMLWLAVSFLRLGVLVAQVAALAITAGVSWFGHSRFTFRRVALPRAGIV